MKSFSSFIFLNVLILFAYAQDQTLPATTCEQKFALKGTTCTPCQQAIFKNGGNDASFMNKKPPSNKCLLVNLFTYHLRESSAATPATPNSTPGTSGTPKGDSARIKDALDKTCADTANNACSESDDKNAYTKIDKACDAELNQYLSSKETYGTGKGPSPISANANTVGFVAKSLILTYYLAIPNREILCSKVNGEYCAVKYSEQKSQTQSQSRGWNRPKKP